MLLALSVIEDSEATDADERHVSLTRVLAEHEAAGASGIVRITLDGELLFESGFGSASCDADEPVSPNHLFMIGSITKEFTQLLAYVLEDKGVLSFDDRVDAHLLEFDGPIGAVTIRQLVDHTGRVPDLIDRNGQPVPYSVEYDYESVSREEMIARAEKAQLIEASDGEDVYSNLGYQLLAAIYESATGASYSDLLQRYVFNPAGMTDMGFWFDDGEPRVFANGCLAGGTHWGNPIDDEMWDAAGPSWNLVGAGGLLSTAESLGMFFDGLAAGLYFETPEQLERYKADRMVFSERRGQLVMGPAGSNGIFNAAAFWTDTDRFNVVLMTNRADHPAEGDLIRDVVRAVGDLR